MLGKIDEFSEQREDWSLYIERLEHYFIANRVTDEQRKKSLMLTAIGAAAYKLLRSMTAPERPNDKSFGELVELMKKHYDPAPATQISFPYSHSSYGRVYFVLHFGNTSISRKVQFRRKSGRDVEG